MRDSGRLQGGLYERGPAGAVDHHGWRGTIHRTVDEQPLYEREEDAALCMRER